MPEDYSIEENIKTKPKLGVVTRKISDLCQTHQWRCHPGSPKLWHYVKQQNLNFTKAEVDQVVRDCQVCARMKLKFFKPATGTLISATKPFENLSIDFKGFLPVAKGTGNQYILTVVDQYSRFPWAFPTRDQSSESVIECLSELIAIGGAPQNIHSDQGSSFMSAKVKKFLEELSIASTRTTPCNP